MRRFFAVPVLAFLCLPASASALPAGISTASISSGVVKRDVVFADNVPKSLRLYYKRAVSNAPKRFRSMNETVDGQLKVAMGSDSLIDGAAAVTTTRPDPDRPYRIYFSKQIDWDEFQASVVSAHELGHVFDIAGVSGNAMRSVFLRQAKKSSNWKSCFKRPDDSSRCMPLAEVFADQVAFWAVPGDFVSGYRIPRLLSGSQMNSVMKRVWKPQATPGNIGGE